MKTLQTFLSAYGVLTTNLGDFSISVLNNPRPPLIARENEKFVDRLVSKLHALSAESFGVELEKKSIDGIRRHIIDVAGLAFLHKHNEVLGFASSKLFPDDECFYLHGIGVTHSFKGEGASTNLVKALWNLTTLPKIAFTTQNLIMFCLLKKLCASVYPSPEAQIVPKFLHNLGMRLVSGRRGELDRATFVIRQLYRKCLYNKIPECRDPSVNQWFAEALKITAGITHDAFLFVGEHVNIPAPQLVL